MAQYAQRAPRDAGGDGLRSGMGTAEMLERFARLNALEVSEVSGHIDDAAMSEPSLRAHAIARRLAAEAGRDAVRDDTFFSRWTDAHGLVPHPGVTWSRVRSPAPQSRLALTLAAASRVRTRAALMRLDADVRRVGAALSADGDATSVLEALSRGARGFAHPSEPRVQAGVHLGPARPWRWGEVERIAALLHRHGLRARFGLSEDQWSPLASVPVVVWNPALADVPVTGTAVAALELRVVGRD